MKIALSGANGLVGEALKEHFSRAGHQLVRIVRKAPAKGSSDIYYDLSQNYIDTAALEGVDIIVHLAGANISGGRWTESYKKEILESRVATTLLLTNAIKKLNRRPKLFLCASAIGYYGNHDASVIVNEHSPRGHGFLADVCVDWENASADLVNLGVRLVHMRFGVILSRKGGALSKMLVPFYLGLGGRLGGGKQPMSWIALDEIPSAVDFIIANEKISGPVNMTAPYAVSNEEFTKGLGQAIGRPTIFPVPAFMVKLLFGQMGQDLLLEGVHAVPEVLVNAGYQFKYPHLKDALVRVL